MIRNFTVPLALLALAACASAPPASKVTEESLRQDPIRFEAFWRAHPADARRLLLAPPEVCDFLGRMNRLQGFGGTPAAPELSPELRRDLEGAIDGLPPAVRKLAQEKLVAVIPMRGVGSTAYTESVFDERGRSTRGWIALDVDAVDRKANDWATWKETSPYSPEPGWELRVRLESDAENTRRQAIQFILVHELAHVIALGSDLHPDWAAKLEPNASLAAYPWAKRSWRVNADRKYASTYDDSVFPLRKSIAYYQPERKRLPISRAAEVFAQLEKTELASPYAALNPYDDFAEAFATYVHAVLLKRPYRFELLRDGQVVRAYGPCWRERRCREKRRMLERLLGQGRGRGHGM